MQFQVTEEHLDRAIKESVDDSSRNSKTCPLHQAVRDIFPTFDPSLISANQFWIWVAEQQYKFYGEALENSKKIVFLFDSKRYDELRKLLPITLELESE